MRGNATRFPNKGQTAIEAEGAMVHYLCNVRPSLRAAITVDTLVAKYNVHPRIAQYRLTLAQAKWAAE